MIRLYDNCNRKQVGGKLKGKTTFRIPKLNKIAKANISGICELKIIEGASHLFEEYGKLEIVAKLSVAWFNKYI